MRVPILFVLCLALYVRAQDDDLLPGWKGEIKRKTLIRNRKTLERLDSSLPISDDAPPPIAKLSLADTVAPGPAPDSYIEQVAWNPRAYVFHGFLSDAEADHLIAAAEPFVKRSTVVDHHTGGSVLDEIRTSSGMFLPRQFDEVVVRIEERLANWTMFPVENGEEIQVLQYQNGQKYGDHWDYFDAGTPGSLADGQRAATVLMYLSDVESGGETCFHDGQWLKEEVQRPKELSPCGSRGVCVKPKKGNALLFYNLKPDGNPDKYSLHTGCPVLEGIKWSATKWIHNKAFRPSTLHKFDVNRCDNDHEMCNQWAKSGECEKNPGYMVGTLINPGACRLACGECKKCPPGDVICMRQNLTGGLKNAGNPGKADRR